MPGGAHPDFQLPKGAFAAGVMPLSPPSLQLTWEKETEVQPASLPGAVIPHGFHETKEWSNASSKDPASSQWAPTVAFHFTELLFRSSLLFS